MRKRAAWLAALCFGQLAAQESFAEAYAAAEELRANGAGEARLRQAYGRAADLFGAAPAEHRDDPGWLPAAAYSAWMAHRSGEAADLFAQSWETGNRDAFHAEHLLRSLWASDRRDGLLSQARTLEQQFPQIVRAILVDEGALHAVAAWEIGGHWLRQGQTDLGLWVFERLVDAGGRHPTSLANLALALRQVGRETESEATYREALTAAPDDAALWNDFGLFYKGAGRNEEAAAAFAESRRKEQEPTGPATVNLLVLSNAGFRVAPVAWPTAISQVLAERPTAALARRACLDAIGREARAAR